MDNSDETISHSSLCHLPVGDGGVVILIMCVTGVLLFTKADHFVGRHARYHAAPPSSGSQRLPVETLIAGTGNIGFTTPDSRSCTGRLALTKHCLCQLYTGQVLGEGSTRTRAFFRTVTDWHRWLGAQGENRNVARAITGACNLGFLFLVVSGFYLWWPKSWTRKFLRNITWFKRGLPSKARDFNWHNVIGFWSAGPLFIVVLSAVVISYTWAGNLVYRIVGETPPAPRANQPAQNTGASKGESGELLKNVTLAWNRAEQQVGDWESITQLPTSVSALYIQHR